MSEELENDLVRRDDVRVAFEVLTRFSNTECRDVINSVASVNSGEYWHSAAEAAREQNAELRGELASLRARPQEPGLSKEWLDELIRGLGISTHWPAGRDVLNGALQLRDAILSAPSGPLSDPEGVFEAMGMDEPKFPTTKKEGE